MERFDQTMFPEDFDREQDQAETPESIYFKKNPKGQETDNNRNLERLRTFEAENEKVYSGLELLEIIKRIEK